LAEELKRQNHKIGDRKVAQLLHDLDYSLQSNRKTKEGASHPDRDAQFEYINTKTKQFQAEGQPVISVDTKKKELIGDFKNVGKDHDTAEFACETISRWWRKMGVQYYANATNLLIIADGGGSNGSRSRLWKVSLQNLADETQLKISVCHFPPGTSKWNKIEHRMFCHITQNWRGKPLVSHEVMVNLIGSTTTRKGLKIRAEMDENEYQTGIKISDKEMAELKIRKENFHGEWNYKIFP
jgi:hypothetical protein